MNGISSSFQIVAGLSGAITTLGQRDVKGAAAQGLKYQKIFNNLLIVNNAMRSDLAAAGVLDTVLPFNLA